jgi:hypothetical protein
LICFAVDSPDSLDNVQEKWISEVLHFLQWPPYHPRWLQEGFALRPEDHRRATQDKSKARYSRAG